MTKKTTIVSFLIALTTYGYGQENARYINSNLAKGTYHYISFGYGSTMPGNASKDAFLTNSSGVNVDLSIPLASFRKGWDGTVKGGSYTSLIVGGKYNFGGSGNPSVALPGAFAISGQTAGSVAYKGVDPRNPGFRVGLGPQVNFKLGEKFTVSPMVLAEYFSMTQKELIAVQTTQYNGQILQYNLWSLPETKTSGFAFSPKIRMKYMVTKSIGLFADGSYIIGPKVTSQLSTLKPEGNPNQEGQYNQKQLQNGTIVKGETTSTSYSALEFNVGFSFSLKPRKGWNGKQEATKTDKKSWYGVSLQSPANNTELAPNETPTFRWTPLVPKPQSPVTYKMRVWQLMEGQNGSQAMKANHPIITKDVIDATELTTGIFTGPCKPPYMCDFVWSVQALDESGNELMSSELAEFSYRKGWDGTVKGGSKILSPANGEEISETPTFRWTPLVPKPQGPITYKLRVWQLMQGQNGSQAMKTNQPIVTKDVIEATEITTGILTGPCKPPYMCNFVWSVQGLDASGNELMSTEPAQFSFRKGWDGTVKGGK